jgi:hypothetical protein
MVISAEVAGGALVSIRRAGQEIAGMPLEFDGTETIDDVVIELTTRVAQVDVTVTGPSASGEPQAVLLVLFSEDPARWHQGHLQSATQPTCACSRSSGRSRYRSGWWRVRQPVFL